MSVLVLTIQNGNVGVGNVF